MPGEDMIDAVIRGLGPAPEVGSSSYIPYLYGMSFNDAMKGASIAQNAGAQRDANAWQAVGMDYKNRALAQEAALRRAAIGSSAATAAARLAFDRENAANLLAFRREELAQQLAIKQAEAAKAQRDYGLQQARYEETVRHNRATEDAWNNRLSKPLSEEALTKMAIQMSTLPSGSVDAGKVPENYALLRRTFGLEATPLPAAVPYDPNK